MANYNRVILVGNLTRDPQLSHLPNGTAATESGIAVNRKWKSQDGMKEEVMFIDFRCYGNQAETMNQSCRKGTALLLEGRLQLDIWQDKAGNERRKHRVIVERFQFLGAKERDDKESF